MAYEKLGIEIVVNGVAKFAQQIGYINASLNRYEKAVGSVEKKIVSLANQELLRAQKAQEAAIKTSVNAVNAYEREKTSISNLVVKLSQLISNQQTLNTSSVAWTQNQVKLNATTNSLKETYNVSSRILGNYVTKITGMITAIIQLNSIEKKSEEDTEKLNEANDDLLKTMEKFAKVITKASDANNNMIESEEKSVIASKNAEQAQEDYNKALGDLAEKKSPIQRFFNVLFSNISTNNPLVEKFGTKLGLTSAKAAALSVALNVVSTVLMTAANIVKGALVVFGALFTIFTKIAGAVIGLGINITKHVVSAFSNLANVGWNAIKGGLSSVWESLKHIGEIAIGMNIDRIIWGIGQQLREVAGIAFDAASSFQMMQIRLEGLMAIEYLDAGQALDFTSALDMAIPATQELLKWITNLGIRTPFSIESIGNVFTLAKSYEFTANEARGLTETIVQFASGMGLSNDAMTKIIENFGQMRAAGKTTGTELRDLARGAFLPINSIFEKMAELANQNKLALAGMTIQERESMSDDAIATMEEFAKLAGMDAKSIRELAAAGNISTDLFFTAFEEFTAEKFPGAVDRLSESIEVARSNVKDFIQAFIGMKILKPFLSTLAQKLSAFTQRLFSDKMVTGAEKLGHAIDMFVKGISVISDKLIVKFFPNLAKGEDLFVNFANGLDRITSAFYAIATGSGNFSNIKGIIESVFGKKITDTLWGFISPLLSIIEYLMGDGNITLAGAFDVIKKSILEDTIPAIQLGIENFFSSIKRFAEKYLPPVIEWVRDGLLNSLTRLSDWLSGTNFGTIAQPFIDVLSSIVSLLAEVAISKVSPGISVPTGMTGFNGVASGVFQYGGSDVTGKLEALNTSLANLGTTIRSFAIDKLNSLKDFLTNAYNDGLKNFKIWIKDVSPYLYSFVNNVNGIDGNQFDKFMLFLDKLDQVAESINNIRLIGSSIMSIATSSERLVRSFTGFKAISSGFFAFLSSLTGIGIRQPETLMSFAEALDYIADAVTSLSDAIGTTVGTGIGTWFSTVSDGISEFLSVWGENASVPGVTTLESIIESIRDVVENVDFGERSRSRWEDQQRILSDTWNNLWDTLTRHSIIPDMIKDIKYNLDTGMKGMETSTVTTINTKIIPAFNLLYTSSVKALTNFMSFVSGTFNPFVEYTMANAFYVFQKDSIYYMSLVYSYIVDILYPAMVSIMNSAKEKIQTFADGVSSSLQGIINTCYGAANALYYLLGAAQTLYDWSQKNNIGLSVGVGSSGTKKVTTNVPSGAIGAKGLDFIVPNNYPNDTFPTWVSSGERVVVLTKSQQLLMNRKTNKINPLSLSGIGSSVRNNSSTSYIQNFYGPQKFELASSDNVSDFLRTEKFLAS